MLPPAKPHSAAYVRLTLHTEQSSTWLASGRSISSTLFGWGLKGSAGSGLTGTSGGVLGCDAATCHRLNCASTKRCTSTGSKSPACNAGVCGQAAQIQLATCMIVAFAEAA